MSNPFSGLHQAMQAQVDQQFLPGVSTALLRGREVVDVFCTGFADREAAVPLREDHLFRMFSSTKLVTSLAILLLLEEGRLQLDDPLHAWVPAMADRPVLRPGATHIHDTEPLRTPITLRHLMTHTAGLSYGIFDPGSVLYKAYGAANVLNPLTPLSGLMEVLATLPLAFQPGSNWEYSVATDVLGHVVERVTGETFGGFLQRRIFDPLGMADTGFWVPEARQHRLATLYVGTNLLDPTQPGLLRANDKPFPGAYLRPFPRQSGGGGLVSTLGDNIRLIQSLMPGPNTLLRPDTLDLLWRNQLPPGMCVQFPNFPRLPGWCHGLGSSVKVSAAPFEPPGVVGEASWGGLAGTIWWINPRLNTAGLLMTQRYFGFGNPYALAFKQAAYQALGG